MVKGMLTSFPSGRLRHVSTGILRSISRRGAKHTRYASDRTDLYSNVLTVRQRTSTMHKHHPPSSHTVQKTTTSDTIGSKPLKPLKPHQEYEPFGCMYLSMSTRLSRRPGQTLSLVLRWEDVAPTVIGQCRWFGLEACGEKQR